MDKLLDIIAKWDHFGQGIFFLIIFSMFTYGVCYVIYCLAYLIRGGKNDIRPPVAH